MPTLQDYNYKHPTAHYYDEGSKKHLCGQSKKKKNTADSSYHVTCLDCISRMRERAIPLQWATHAFIENARALQDAAMYLDKRPEAQFPQQEQDVLPFLASFHTSPFLLAFAIELALKAFICSERPGPPPLIHDLFRLYKALQPNTQTCLNARFLSLHPHLADSSLHIHLCDLHFPPRPVQEPLQVILETHRNLFHYWRYPPLQHCSPSPEITHLHEVLTFLIKTFHHGWPARQSSFDFPPE